MSEKTVEKTYHWCVVPDCKNTSKNSKDKKLFIAVPKQPDVRQKWLQLARRDYKALSATSSLYFCEDHFDLPNDMENYMENHLMGVKRIIMKKNCLPSKFECQTDRKKRTSSTVTRPAAIKRQRLQLIEEAENEYTEATTSTEKGRTFEIDLPETEKEIQQEEQPTCNRFLHKSVQVRVHCHFRSKGIQCCPETRNVANSPAHFSGKSVSTSPIKRFPEATPTATKIIQSDSDSSFLPSSQTKLSESTEVDEERQIQEEKQQIKSCTIQIIAKNPRFYVGLPKPCFFLVNIISRECYISEENILLCLKKIRLNSTFTELADSFGITQTHSSRIFTKNIPLIARYLSVFIKSSSKVEIKRNLPIAFRYRFNNVYCIIDCLEIEIQKPSKSLHQALTWSEYKKRNTIKYLISCTPDGLINYISPGYGGRISDVQLVETSNFLDTLPVGSCVLADRGFKHLENLLFEKGLTLLRPPSVSKGEKLTRQNVRQTKKIASLRIHVERVIRRVREFSALKGHAVVHHNLIDLLDHVIMIACALINVQDPIIR